MIKRIALIAIAGLVLASCGTVSATTAIKKWQSASSYASTHQEILSDARHSATALETSSSSILLLHTVCGVLLLETEQANAALPTPDTTATNLLSTAYDDFGAGANLCYRAGASASKRQAAIAMLQKAASYYAEADARIAAIQ